MSDKLNDDIVIEGSAVQDNSYNIEESNSLGKVQIADDVVAIIAGLAERLKVYTDLQATFQMSLPQSSERRTLQRALR